MQDLFPMFLNAVGGVLLGPILSKLFGGKRGIGTFLAVIGGVLGGVGAGKLTQEVGFDLASFMGGGDMMRMLANVIEGGVGGGLVGLIASRLSR